MDRNKIIKEVLKELHAYRILQEVTTEDVLACCKFAQSHIPPETLSWKIGVYVMFICGSPKTEYAREGWGKWLN